MYLEFINDYSKNINFDDKWYLFPFKNFVYDLNKQCFREFKYHDYISKTTKYD